MKLIEDQQNFPEREPPGHFHLYMPFRFVKEIGGVNWALNWKLDDGENEEAGYNIPVQYNKRIKEEDFEDLFVMDDMFVTLLNILKNDRHLSKSQMLKLFKMVLDCQHDYDDMTMFGLRTYLNRNWSTDETEEKRNTVFRMMVDIVTIKKLGKKTDQEHTRIIKLYTYGSSMLTIERIRDRIIEIKGLLKTFDGAIITERVLSQADGRNFDETRLLDRLFSIFGILTSLNKTSIAEIYIMEHGPLIDTWIQAKVMNIALEFEYFENPLNLLKLFHSVHLKGA